MIRLISIYIRIERIHTAIGIINAEIPDAFVTAPGGLAEVESQIKTVIITELQIIRRGIMIFSRIRVDMRKHGNAASFSPVPAYIGIEAFCETMAGSDVYPVTMVISVRIPVVPEGIETSEIPRQGI